MHNATALQVWAVAGASDDMQYGIHTSLFNTPTQAILAHLTAAQDTAQHMSACLHQAHVYLS